MQNFFFILQYVNSCIILLKFGLNVYSSDYFSLGARVIMACRDMGKCKIAQEEITETSANRNVVCERLDLASLDSIREFADNINNSENPFEYAINYENGVQKNVYTKINLFCSHNQISQTIVLVAMLLSTIIYDQVAY